MFNRLKLGEILLEMGAIREADLQSALDTQTEKGGRLGELLLAARACEEKHLALALGRQLGCDVKDSINPDEVDLDLIARLSLRWSRESRVLPLFAIGDEVVVAVADPLNLRTLDQLRFVLQREPVPVIVPTQPLLDAINAAFDRKLRVAGGLTEGLENVETKHQSDDVPEIEDILVQTEGDDEAPVIQFVNSLFVRAVRERTSDIHIEPAEQSLHVRYRIDGVLKEVAQPPKRFQSSIIARIKIMAGLDIAERRLPQDGRIRIKIAGKDIDVRVATAPATHGERITMRLLDRSAVLLDLDAMDMAPDILGELKRLAMLPHGIILVTGPTGSGKTTTLYAALSYINTPDKNILTVEDPVEYQLKGISQMQVNAKIGLTFASGLRSYLRHDPDVILVGEIRDQVTADIAIEASLTGHLVFSTLHTNDSAGAFTRLIEMGVEPFLVASSVQAALAQRLLRRLCRECREPYVPSATQLAEINLTPEDVERVGGHVYRANGCATCLNTGYSGRRGIYEMLVMNEEVNQLIMRKEDAATIKRAALRHGMRTLRDDGALKVLQGVTSIEEVLRVTKEELA